MIKVNNLFKYFDHNEVLKDVSLEVNDGETLTIIGPSGCGKSTLLKLVTGLMDADSGKILIDGMDITTLGEKDLKRFRKKFGIVFQSSALFDSLNVYDNVAFGLRESKSINEAIISRIVSEKLDWVGLAGKEEMAVSDLSGGMRKRVGIARALAFDPEILIFDEPTTGLDPIVSKNVENLIVKLKNEIKITAIVVTHQLSTIFRVSDRILYLNNGKIKEVGSVDDLRVTEDMEIKEFIRSGMVS